MLNKYIYLTSLSGLLKHISVSDKTIWGVNSGDDIFTARNIQFTEDGKIHFDWQHIPGKLKQISVNVDNK